MTKILSATMIPRFGVGVGLLGIAAASLLVAPSASAAPDCSPAAVSTTVDSVTGSAQQYLAAHPGANAVVSQAISQPRPQATTDVRSYFTAHPQEYYELRGILAPIGETQRQCQTTVLPSGLASAYAEFMAG
ncbi:MAG: heme-binding protein [Mycobacterium sp.]